MNKQSFFWLGSLVFLFMSCTPKDPEVLSPADQRARSFGNNSDRADNRREGRRGGDRPELPKDTDLAFAQLALDKNSEVIQSLFLALKLVENSGELKNLDRCSRFQTLEKSAQRWVLASQNRGCASQTAETTQKTWGRIRFEILLDDSGFLQAVKMISSETEPAGEFLVELSKKSAKGVRAQVREQFVRSFERVSQEPLVFQVLEARSESQTWVRSDKKREAARVVVVQDGKITLAKNSTGAWTALHGLETAIKFDSEVENGAQAYLDLILFPRSEENLASEDSGFCPNLAGRYGLEFNYTPALSRRNHELIVTSQKLEVRDVKNADNPVVSSREREGCQAPKKSFERGFWGANWGSIFIH